MDKKYYISTTKYNVQERQTKKNGTVYDCVFRITDLQGHTFQKKLSGFTTKKLLKQAFLKFVGENCEIGKNVAQRIDPQKDTPTVEKLVLDYLRSLRNANKDSSIYDKTKIYGKFFLPYYGKEKITALTREELFKWQSTLWSTPSDGAGNFYSQAYLSKIRAHVGAFLSYVENAYGYKNYLPEIKKPKRTTAKAAIGFWTKEEFETFISVVDDPLYKCLFSVLFYTGRRKGEILCITKDDIDLGKCKVSFTKSLTRKTLDDTAYKITPTKAYKNATLPLCRQAVQAFKEYSGENGFYFGGEKPLAENTITRKFNKYIELSGVKPITIHGLRHSFVSMLIHNGTNIFVVAELISDTVEQVEKTYGHLYNSDINSAVQSISNLN